jgi:glycosyltransferase involved in cell wall biosynthesis
VGEGGLEEKLKGCDYAFPVIERAQTPWHFLRSVGALRSLAARLNIDLVHTHLSYDHWLSHVAFGRRRIPIVRTFHARRPLRRDPVTRHLIARTSGLAVVNPTFLTEPPIRGRHVELTPPPVDGRLFHPDGPDVRSSYGLVGVPVIGVIGKITPGRGFEDALAVFARIHEIRPDCRFLIIGRGYLLTYLERLARHLGIAESVIWAGYHEDDLAEHYRAMDLMIFTSTGSDEGHRAVSEAMACGTPVATWPIAGMEAVTGPLTARVVTSQPSTEELALKAVELLATSDPLALRRDAAAAVAPFAFAPTAERLTALYREAMRGA